MLNPWRCCNEFLLPPSSNFSKIDINGPPGKSNYIKYNPKYNLNSLIYLGQWIFGWRGWGMHKFLVSGEGSSHPSPSREYPDIIVLISYLLSAQLLMIEWEFCWQVQTFLAIFVHLNREKICLDKNNPHRNSQILTKLNITQPNFRTIQ